MSPIPEYIREGDIKAEEDTMRKVYAELGHKAKARRRFGLQIASFIVCAVLAYLILREVIPIGVHP